MIAVENLSKSYGEQALFDEISFKINRKERVGLVGRNGHGKTTLLRMIAGLEEPDSGVISIPRNYRIGYLEQRLDFRGKTVFQEAARGLPAPARDESWRVEKILSGLGFTAQDFTKHPLELAGGFQVRLNLAKILLAEDNMLILDEPINFLDITSIRWLEKILLRWPGELMLVTHDRSFMDKVVTHTLAIHRRKVKKIAGDTGKLYGQIAQEEETYEKTRVNDERKRKEIEAFIDKFRASAQLTGLVQSRKKTLARMGKKEKLEKIQSLEFNFSFKPFFGKYIMTVADLSFSYEPSRRLIGDFGLSIGPRDRVFVIGKNGKGKTTLLKLLAGVLIPDRGEVLTPAAATVGYFEQSNVRTLSDHHTVLDEIASAIPDQDSARARHLSGMMMFEGDNALKKIAVLSGGEKSRVMLGKLIATPVNLLLLDEPTNHLDMESSDALLSALDNFDGAVVMVTHNELFLEALAERLIVFQDDGISVFEGTYERFLEKVGWQEESERPRLKAEDKAFSGPDIPEPLPPSPRELRKQRSEVIAERSFVLRPLEKKIAQLERAIEKATAEESRMNADIIRAAQARDSARIVELSKSVHQLRRDLDARLEALEPLLQEFERKKDEFEKRLEALAE
jgi:ATP-binding cassette subfamily F protein 3